MRIQQPSGPQQIVPQGDYTVQQGDTLASLASKFGTTPAALAKANNLSVASVLTQGQHLNMPIVGGDLLQRGISNSPDKFESPKQSPMDPLIKQSPMNPPPGLLQKQSPMDPLIKQSPMDPLIKQSMDPLIKQSPMNPPPGLRQKQSPMDPLIKQSPMDPLIKQSMDPLIKQSPLNPPPGLRQKEIKGNEE